MCFGPVASFASGVVLAGAGTATLKATRSRKELLIAAFPLIFAAQQIIEGFIWLGMEGGPLQAWVKPLTVMYLFFAYVVWPVFFPVSVYLLEPKKINRRLLLILIGVGIFTAGFLTWFAFTYPHYAEVVKHSLRYHEKKFSNEAGALYLSSTYIPYLVSSFTGLRLLGVVNIIFAVFSRIVYKPTFDSVWCFFAALLSLGIYFFLRSPEMQRARSARA